MRELESLSGSWLGFWVQHRSRGHMEMALGFANGRVAGSGMDRVGPFLVAGEFDTTGEVSFCKSYATHKVHYGGFWDGTMIHGDWLIEYGLDYHDAGEFEIWPEGDQAGSILAALNEEFSMPKA